MQPGREKARSEKARTPQSAPPPDPWRQVGSLGVGGGVTTVIRHCIYVPNIKVAFKAVSTFLF